MDYFEPFAETGADATALTSRFLLISFDTDWRFGSEHSAHLAAELRRRGAHSEHIEIHSPWGHDSFLLPVPEYHRLVARFLAAPAADRNGRLLAIG